MSDASGVDYSAKIDDGSPESLRAVELFREAATLLTLSGSFETKNSVLSAVVSEVSNDVRLLPHFVHEAAFTAATVAAFAANLGPDEATADEVLRVTFATLDELRRPPS